MMKHLYLDDEIMVCHTITCNDCDSIFTNMNNWLKHKHKLDHIKDTHTVSILISNKTLLYENVLVFNNKDNNDV